MEEFRIDAPGGHLDQMIRQTRAHHVTLSNLADLKASVLLTTAALVMPLSLRFLEHPTLHFPALVMTGFSSITVLLAAYGTMPKFGKPSKDPRAPDFDLLFFGYFTQLDRPTYLHHMQEAMNDPSRTYAIQLEEIYQIGSYLARAKYRWIRYAYLSFISGVVTSSLSWGIVLLTT
jgi:hypothetical protein